MVRPTADACRLAPSRTEGRDIRRLRPDADKDTYPRARHATHHTRGLRRFPGGAAGDFASAPERHIKDIATPSRSALVRHATDPLELRSPIPSGRVAPLRLLLFGFRSSRGGVRGVASASWMCLPAHYGKRSPACSWRRKDILRVMTPGVDGVRRTLGYSKRDLLLFRHLHVMGLIRQLTFLDDDPQLRADCEYLADNGYLLSAPEHQRELAGLEVPPYLPEEYHTGKLRNYHELAGSLRHNANLGLRDVPIGLSQELVFVLFATGVLREFGTQLTSFDVPGGELVISALLRQFHTRSVPIMNRSMVGSDWRRLKRAVQFPDVLVESAPDFGIIEMVLSRLPVPGDHVPLEDILAFSRDHETRRRMAGLDIWMRQSAQSGKELEELRLEMEQALHEFSNYMKLADMRSHSSGLRIVLSMPFGVIEELLHLRPKSAMDVVFEYRDRKANRLEAELSAPGGALAYLYEAERQFGK